MEGLWHELFAPMIAAATGAGAGAYFAFLYERRNRAKHIEDEHVTATNIAMFTLVSVFNDLVVYSRQYIEPHRKDPQRWINWRPTTLTAPIPFDTASLSYLFELKAPEAKNLPMKVRIELSRYDAIYGAAAQRFQVHTTEAQPALQEGTRRMGDQYGPDQIIVATTGGMRLLATLTGLTDQLIELVEASIKTIPETARELFRAAKAQYPNREIVKLTDEGIEAALHGPLPAPPYSGTTT
jgi:hypothetical protein